MFALPNNRILKLLKTALLLLLFPLKLFCISTSPVDGKNFVIVIPSYNNKNWYKHNLDSVFSQSYENYRIIYIDDASPDGTGNFVKEYIRKRQQEDRVTLLQNDVRVGALANLYRAIHLCSPDEIIVNLDGDDWLAHEDVLTHLNAVYADRNVWLTYGQFIYYPSYEIGIGEEIPKEVIEQNGFRVFTRGTTALRTFYAGLFHRIKKEDLFHQGDFFQAAYDLAIMLPMLEMAGKHTKFIPDVSYVYNIGTNLNDHIVRPNEQSEIDRLIRKKEKYSPLSALNEKSPGKKIYITPGQWGQLFAIDNPIFNRDDCLSVLYKLREIALDAGYELVQADSLENLGDFDYLVVFDVFPEQMPYLERIPKEKLILFLWEPPSVMPNNFCLEYHDCFSKVYTWNDLLVDDQKYFKFYYPVYHPMISDPIDFEFKRLCTLIACNKHSSHPGELYTERRKLIEFFEARHFDEFELYGRGWPNYYKTYQGPIERKVDYLKYYKFCFAYENIKNIPGYITEKIFDCFQAGCVPIYWGAPNIAADIPPNCFISREDFEDDSSLYEFLKTMTAAQYNEYLRNIRLFLESDASRRYSIDRFIETFMDLITN